MAKKLPNRKRYRTIGVASDSHPEPALLEEPRSWRVFSGRSGGRSAPLSVSLLPAGSSHSPSRSPDETLASAESVAGGPSSESSRRTGNSAEASAPAGNDVEPSVATAQSGEASSESASVPAPDSSTGATERTKVGERGVADGDSAAADVQDPFIEPEPSMSSLSQEARSENVGDAAAGSVGTPVAEQPKFVRESLAGKSVCPFCGQQKTSSSDACPRCTMQDTPTTRQATKARIGPWYVLQNRSPSAPGMKFSTLLWLVSKGHVTPRSIVRGPTTHQLWRYAAHVRGLSREFGVCYSCGAELERTDSTCSDCERPQDPPAEPDSLLEPRDRRQSALKPVPFEQENPPRRQQSFEADRYSERYSERPGSGFVEQPIPLHEPSHAERLRLRNELEPQPPVLAASRSPSLRGLHANEHEVSAMNLVAALRGPGEHETPDRRVGALNLVLFFLLLIVGGAAAFLYLKPEYRAPAAEWVNRTWSTVRDKATAMQWKALPGEAVPPTVALESRAQAQPEPQPKPVLTTPAPQETATAQQAKSVLPPVEEPAEKPAVQEPQVLASRNPVEDRPAEVQKPQPQQQKPQPQAQPKRKPSQEQVAAADPQKTLDRAIDEARTLWIQALDAEANDDFSGAVRLYEKIKQLPSGAWPGGLDINLALARKRAEAAARSE